MLDSRLETLNLLKQELDFLERGGYGGAFPWRPVSMFLDSPSCPNRLDVDRSAPCQQCWLFRFVPAEFRQESPPCHFISLNQDGETLYSMYRQYTTAEVEAALRAWLRSEIGRLELPENHPKSGITGAH